MPKIEIQKHPQPIGWGCCFLAAVQEELLADGAQHLLENGHCHVICEGDAVLGTMALIQGPDPTYSYIEGSWPDERPYYAIHRIATAAPGRNVAKALFDWAFEHIAELGYEVIRIDTHRDNCIMKHILTKYGFTMCGVIYLENGDPRDAYHRSNITTDC